MTVAGLAIDGTDAGNYNLTNSSAIAWAAITKKGLAISATAADKVYDTTKIASATLSCDMLSGDSLTLSNTSALFDSKDVGRGKTVTVSGLSIGGIDAGNYYLQNTIAITYANISKADDEKLHASINAFSKIINPVPVNPSYKTPERVQIVNEKVAVTGNTQVVTEKVTVSEQSQQTNNKNQQGCVKDFSGDCNSQSVKGQQVKLAHYFETFY